MSAVVASSLHHSFPIHLQRRGEEACEASSIRRSRHRTNLSMRSLPSGNASLDALLPGGGWPLGGLTEILVDKMDSSELGLLLPAIAALTRSRQRVAIIGAPSTLERSTLIAAGIDLGHLVQIDSSISDAHWSAEQYLRAGGCAAVVSWQSSDDYRQLRILQLAAEAGTALAFVFRSTSAIDQRSPAALRLKIASGERGNCIEILKCRGMLNA